jgi:BirA family biotin operon repressor/biotin-[acetyl-CoA-carboxylase] ligase
MTLTEQTVIQRLTPRPARYFESVGSTNDVGLAWLLEGAAAGSVVIANEQVKGRGRSGRSWYTPPDTALILSYILHPKAEHLPRVTMMGPVSICELIENLTPQPPLQSGEGESKPAAQHVGIKWPNDVQVNGLKVSGVLPEAVWQGERLVGVVLGMGINIRVNFADTELDGKAISLETALGRRLNRLDLLARWLDRLDNWSAHLDEVYEPWQRRLKTLGERVSLMNSGKTVNGMAEAVDRDGALLVRDSYGALHRVVAGDIALGRMMQPSS